MAITPPTNVVATVISSTRINLTWENTYYYDYIAIWRNVAGSGYNWYKARIPGSDEYFEDSDLNPEIEYCYKLKGRILDPFQKSAFSAEDCGTTWATLLAPTLCVATPISDIEIDITFKDNSEFEDNHRLERKLGAGSWEFVVDLESNREFFRDGGLFLLESGYTDCEDSDIGKQVKDDTVEIGVLVAFDNARRRWVLDSGNTIADASAMTITAGTGAGTAARETTGLVKGSSYTYRVRAEQSLETPTAYVESAQVTTISEPSDPTVLVISDVQDKSMQLSWTDNSDNETGFKIEKSDTGAFGGEEEEIAIIGVNITEFLVTGLDPSTQYWFRVRAYNAAGDSGYSNEPDDTTLATYVPTAFEQWIRRPNIEPIYLAEIYARMTLTGFTLQSGVTWKKTIGASDRGIDILEVFEDSVLYVEKTSIATVEATASTFWFDYDNRILYVHTSDSTDPANFFIEGAFWLYFSTHKDIEFTANGRLQHYLPLLAKEDIPDVTQEIKPYFEGSFGLGSGSIAFKNAQIMGEYFFDIKFATYTWINSKVVLKAGNDSFTYAQFKEIFTLYIDSKSCSDTKIAFQLRDVRKVMSQSIVLDKFNTTDYPDIEDRYVDKPIPIAFGTRKLEIPVPIDMLNQKFKFNASSIAARSKGVEGALRNRAVLVEDVHYFIDLQRSIITFNRDGAFIIDATNNKINFKEGGGELTATLDSKTYTTTELGDEIKRVMDIAGALTYTVTVTGAPERRFTISAGGVFDLLWRTGTNGKDGTGTNVSITIGFDDDKDLDDESSYEAEDDVITIVKGDIIEITFTGFVNSADEIITNGAEIFKFLMNNYRGMADSELNLDSIYESKYSKAEPPELTFLIGSEPSFDEIIRTLEHSIEAYTFQDEFGRLGIKPQQTTVASNVKYVISEHIFSHSQKKGRTSLFWKVNVFFNKDYEDDWEERTATDNEINWKHKITAELPINTYFKTPLHASNLATAVLLLLNKETIESDLPMLMFDVMAGDIIKFSRDRFYDSDGTASEIELRVIRISKSPASGRTSITAEAV